MADNEPKQIIVIRTDLRNTQGHKIRTGKLIAQGAHASMKAILNLGSIIRTHPQEQDYALHIDVTPEFHPALYEWLEGRFTKICVGIDSEEELIDIYFKAKEAGLICSLIQDAGLTEFDGVLTYTCCAIGPAYPEQLQPITGDLKLL